MVVVLLMKVTQIPMEIRIGNSESNIGYAINDGKNGNDKECVTDFENC